MYKEFRALQKWFLRLDPIWQHAINVILLLVFLAALLLELEVPKSIQSAVVIAAPALFIVNVALSIGLRALRRRQLTREESGSSLSAFRTSEQFAQLFSDKVEIAQGEVIITDTIPSFSFIRSARTHKDIEALSVINSKEFRSTAWEDPNEKKLRRNLSFLERNRDVFWVLDKFSISTGRIKRNEGGPDPFFFSCILPLTEFGFRSYFLDKLAGDNDFRPTWIAPEGTNAHSLLMFTFARDLDYIKSISGDQSTYMLGFYIRCCGIHLEHLMRAHFKSSNAAAVYFQNSDPAFANLAKLAGMERSELTSLDGEITYVTTVKVDQSPPVD